MFFCSQVAALARAASRHERWARAAAEETAGPAQRGRPRVPAGPAHERARAGVHADGVRRCWLKAKRRKNREIVYKNACSTAWCTDVFILYVVDAGVHESLGLFSVVFVGTRRSAPEGVHAAGVRRCVAESTAR